VSDGLKNSVIQGVKWFAISKTLLQLFRWTVTFIVIRELEQDDYGLVALAGISIAILKGFNFLSIKTVIIKFQELTDREIDSLFTLCIAIGTVFFLLAYSTAPLLAYIYDSDRIVEPIRVLSFIFLIDIFTIVPAGKLSKELNFKSLSKISLAAGVLSSFIVLLFALNGMGYWSLVAGVISLSIATAVFTNIAKFHKPILCWEFSKLKEQMSFGMYNSFAGITSEISDIIGIMIGGLFISEEKLGAYKVGMVVSSMPLRKISPEIRRISFAAFSAIQTDEKRIISNYLKSIQLSSWILFPVFFGFASVAPGIVSVILGEKWHESTVVIQIVSLALPFTLFHEISASLLVSLGQAKLVSKLSLLNLIMYATLLLIGAQYGVMGLAGALFVISPIKYLISTHYLCKNLPLRSAQIFAKWSRQLLFSSVMSLGILGVSVQIDTYSVISLGAVIFTGVVIYLLQVLLFAKVEFKEIVLMFKSK